MMVKEKWLKAAVYANLILYPIVIFLYAFFKENPTVVFIFNLYEVMAFWIVGALAFSVTYLSYPPMRERKAWELIGLGFFFYGLSDLFWALSTSSLIVSMDISFMQDVLYLLSSILWVVGVGWLFYVQSRSVIPREVKEKLSFVPELVTTLLALTDVAIGIKFMPEPENWLLWIFSYSASIFFDLVMFLLALKAVLMAKTAKFKELMRMWRLFLLGTFLLFVFDSLYMLFPDFFSTYSEEVAYLWVFPAIVFSAALPEYLRYLKRIPPSALTPR